MEAMLNWKGTIIDGNIYFILWNFSSFCGCCNHLGFLSVLHALSGEDGEIIDMLAGCSDEAKSVIGDKSCGNY